MEPIKKITSLYKLTLIFIAIAVCLPNLSKAQDTKKPNYTQQQASPPPPPPPQPPRVVENNEDINVSEQTQEKGQIFTIVENMPTYKGCESMDSEAAKQDCTKDKIIAYLGENLKYPEEAQSQEVEGRVFVSYIVDKQGNVTDVEVLRGIPNGEVLDEEAVRVIKNLPNFNPGMQRGKTVAVRYNIPINFTMNEADQEAE